MAAAIALGAASYGQLAGLDLWWRAEDRPRDVGVSRVRARGPGAPAQAGGYQITTAFLQAAAGADIVQRSDGGFAYDLESVAARLVH